MNQDKVPILVKKASLECDKLSYPLLEPYHLTLVQYKILKFLYCEPPMTVRQIDIEKFYSLTNPTVTGILQNLERDDWVERLPNPKDARSKVIRLTEKAEKSKKALYDIGNSLERQLTKNLDKQEKEQLVSLLKKLLEGAGKK